MWSSNEYNTGDDGCRNEKPGKATPLQAADAGLALNMQYSATTYPSKNMNFMSYPSLYHHPQHEASIDFGGGHGSSGGGRHLLFDNSTATSNHIAPGTSFVNTTGSGEMQKMVFTASQLQEFENQTIIYKHILSSNPIPPQLLIPLSTQYNRSDSEPWRCRRTDGKKWRCSRDVMPDQKYCERHAHKNRPRSRKPVETHSQNAKNLNSNDNYHSTLHPATSVPTSCQQSRYVEWYMKGGTTPLSSSHQKIQKPMCSASVGSKRDHFFQNLEGSYQDLVEGDSCSLSLMQPGGDYTCVDQDYFQMGTGILNAADSNQLVHQGPWLGGPLGEALCPGVVSSLSQPSNVSSPNDSGHGLP